MVEFSVKQRNCKRNKVCGDVVCSYDSETNFKIVLCDGLGHGIKANVLAYVTAEMVKRHNFNSGCLSSLTEKLLSIQPVCAIRNINHSTYTVINYQKDTRVVEIVNYDNPKPIIFVNNEFVNVKWQTVVNESYEQRPQDMQFVTIPVEGKISILLCSDGVVQSGMGKKYPFGWGEKRLKEFVLPMFQRDSSAMEIATNVMVEALELEDDYTHDDTTCIVMKILV